MTKKSRTAYVEALNSMRHEPRLKDEEKMKIINFLKGDACKKHMAEAGMGTYWTSSANNGVSVQGKLHVAPTLAPPLLQNETPDTTAESA